MNPANINKHGLETHQCLAQTINRLEGNPIAKIRMLFIIFQRSIYKTPLNMCNLFTQNSELLIPYRTKPSNIRLVPVNHRELCLTIRKTYSRYDLTRENPYGNFLL